MDTTDPGFYVTVGVSSWLASVVAGLTFVVVLTLAVAAGVGVEPDLRSRVLTLMGVGRGRVRNPANLTRRG